MINKTLISILVAGGLALTVQASHLQKVVATVEYELTVADSEATARAYAIKKAESEALSKAISDYSIKTSINGNGDVSEDSTFSIGRIDSNKILSEGIQSCSNSQNENSKCYHLKMEAMVDAGYVSPTPEQLEQANKALEALNELLIK